jgi:hypothetical protein
MNNTDVGPGSKNVAVCFVNHVNEVEGQVRTTAVFNIQRTPRSQAAHRHSDSTEKPLAAAVDWPARQVHRDG